jgi:hypothetical protein
MPLYNGNVNIIEGGNSLLQLYNYPPAITFVTTGSNRVIFKTKENVFCGGLELQWSKDATFDSGSTTTFSASISCTSSLDATLLPLANITGAYEQFIGYDDPTTFDDGDWYLRLRGENALVLNPTFLPSSSFSDPILIHTNNRFSCITAGTIYDSNEVFYVDSFNSSSNIWYTGTGLVTASLIPGGSPGAETYPFIQRSGSASPQVAGLGLNKGTLALNGAGFSYYRGPILSGSNIQSVTPGALFVERGKVSWDLGRWVLQITIASGSEQDYITGNPQITPVSSGAPGPIFGNFKCKGIYCVPQQYQSGLFQNINVVVDGIVRGVLTININNPVPSTLSINDISNGRVQVWAANNGPAVDFATYNCVYLTDN